MSKHDAVRGEGPDTITAEMWVAGFTDEGDLRSAKVPVRITAKQIRVLEWPDNFSSRLLDYRTTFRRAIQTDLHDSEAKAIQSAHDSLLLKLALARESVRKLEALLTHTGKRVTELERKCPT